MKINNFTLMLLSAVMMTLMFSSCSEKDENESALYDGDCIPADASIVARANLTQLLNEAGVTFNDKGTPIYSDELKKGLGNNELILGVAGSYLQDLDKSVNLSDVLMFSYRNRHFLLAQLKDDKAAKKMIKDVMSVTLKNVDGFETGQVGDYVIALSDKMLWLTDGKLLDIQKSMEGATNNSFAKWDKLTQWLTDGWTVSVVAQPGAVKPLEQQLRMSAFGNLGEGTDSNENYADEDDDVWFAFGMKIDKNVINQKFSIFDRNQNLVDFGSQCAPIDVDFLKYAPAGTNLVFGFGGTQNKSASETLSGISYGIYDGQGTFGAAVAITDDSQNAEQGSKDKIMMFIQATSQRISVIKDLLTSSNKYNNISENEMISKSGRDYLNVIPNSGIIYSDYNLKEAPGATPFTSKLRDKRGAMYGNFALLPVNELLGTNYRMDVSGELNDTNISASFTLVGDGTPSWIQTIIRTALAQNLGTRNNSASFKTN